ncbi:Sec-independent protein translocase subunit TatA/TatB [Candidatus Karelsulcia muelleri]|uniref:Sec-independent protein translocase subunit TatA/TatB n=1 Tax=Candidatus Karelsulcia muelleri TaxID=336810 RepID=UPI000D7C0CB9|nr:twin-arginine translocase TatA/TatE family subunit [Candidatus Karelsulcia muelleri]
MNLLLGSFGTTEIVVIVFLALLLFGGKKIPEFMKGLGLGLKEFREAINQVQRQRI